MTNTFMLNWADYKSKSGLKTSNFHLENNYAKFYINGNIEVYITISYKAIAVACSGDDHTFTRTWKEDPITLDEIKKEIDDFLEDCIRKLK